MNDKKTSIKYIREYRHWQYWSGIDDITEIFDDFLLIQTYGKRCLSEERYNHIQPLIWAQKTKEITIKNIIEESIEFWLNGEGAIIPILCVFENNKMDGIKMDRKTLKTIIKIYRKILLSPYDFFTSYTGISKEQKIKMLKMLAEKE
jgi:hypothetical protein